MSVGSDHRNFVISNQKALILVLKRTLIRPFYIKKSELSREDRE
jgi:hypothetical protein